MQLAEETQSEQYHNFQVSETNTNFSLFMCKVLFYSKVMFEKLYPFSERIFVGRSHVARVAEARVEQINRYCQVHTHIYMCTHSHL